MVNYNQCLENKFMGQSCTRPTKKDVVAALPLSEVQPAMVNPHRRPQSKESVRMQFEDMSENDHLEQSYDKGRNTFDNSRHTITKERRAIDTAGQNNTDAERNRATGHYYHYDHYNNAKNKRDERDAKTERTKVVSISPHGPMSDSLMSDERFAHMQPRTMDDNDESLPKYSRDRDNKMIGELKFRAAERDGQNNFYISEQFNDQLDLNESAMTKKGKMVFITPEFTHVANKQRNKCFDRIGDSNDSPQVFAGQKTPIQTPKSKEAGDNITKATANESINDQTTFGGFHAKVDEANHPSSKLTDKKATGQFKTDPTNLPFPGRHARLTTFGANQHANLKLITEVSDAKQQADWFDASIKEPTLDPTIEFHDRPLPLNRIETFGDPSMQGNHESTLRKPTITEEAPEQKSPEGSIYNRNPSMPSGVAGISRENLSSAGYINSPQKAASFTFPIKPPIVLQVVVDQPFQHQSFSSFNDPLEELEQRIGNNAY